MSIELHLQREGNRLCPADPNSAEAMLVISAKETVYAKIQRPRNPKHHRKLWALLNAVYENQTLYPTAHDLLDGIKLATGLFDQGKTIEGIPFVAPKSISFASMDQTRFEQWYARALEVVLTKILPNINRADLEQRINEIMEGKDNGRQRQ